MSVGFAGIEFQVTTSDGRLPLPARDNQGIYYYEAEILVDTRTHYRQLESKLSVTTVKPAMGTIGLGLAVVERGPGSASLTYPDEENEEVTVTAILLEYKGRSLIGRDGPYRVNVKFVLTETPGDVD